MKKYKGELLLLITAIMWGSGFVGMAIGLEYWTVFQLMANRFVLASLLLTLIFYKKLKLITPSVLWKGALLGAILFGAFTLQTVSLHYTTPSKNAFLTALNVIIVPVIGFIIYKRRIDRFEFIAAGIALVGIALLSLQDTFTIGWGDWLAIFCAVGFAFDIFYTNVFVKTEDALALTLVQFYTASLLSVLAVIGRGEIPTAVSMNGALVIVYLAVFSTGVAYVAQNVGMQYANPTKSAIILSTEALFGTLFSVVILHEVLTGRMMMGAVLIFVAILFAEIKPSFRKKKFIPPYQLPKDYE